MRMLIAACAVALSCLPVAAAECKYPMDETMGSIAAAGAPIAIVKPEELPDLLAALEPSIGKIEGNVTRAFIFGVPDGYLLAIEVDGCLIPPVRLATTASAPLSGRAPSGDTGA